jgi:hypothetical protein
VVGSASSSPCVGACSAKPSSDPRDPQAAHGREPQARLGQGGVLSLGQLEVRGCGVGLHLGDGRCTGDDDDLRMMDQPCERGLAGGGTVAGRRCWRGDDRASPSRAGAREGAHHPHIGRRAGPPPGVWLSPAVAPEPGPRAQLSQRLRVNQAEVDLVGEHRSAQRLLGAPPLGQAVVAYLSPRMTPRSWSCRIPCMVMRCGKSGFGM